MVARLDLPAACADLLLCAILVDHSRPLVRYGQRAVYRRHAECIAGRGVFRPGRTGVADIASPGQRIAQHQHVAVAQLIVRQVLQRIIGPAADGIQPSRSRGIIELPNGILVAGIQRKACQIDAAPQCGVWRGFAKDRIDLRQIFFLAVRWADLIIFPAVPQRVRPRGHVRPVAELFQIERQIKTAAIALLRGRPAKTLHCRPERLSCVLAPDRLRHGIGGCLAGEYLITNGARRTEAQHRHVDIDAGPACGLPLAGALAAQRQCFLAAVSIGILAANAQNVLVFIASLRILGNHRILQPPADGSIAAQCLAVQRHNSVAGGHSRDQRPVVLFLAPRLHRHRDFCSIQDLCFLVQTCLDLNDPIAAQLIGHIDRKCIGLPASGLRRHLKLIFAFAAV